MQHANEAKPPLATLAPAPHRALAAIALWVAASLASHSASNACPPGPDLGTASDEGGLWSEQRAHPDSQFEADNQGPYLGAPWREADGGSPEVSFPSSGVTLRSWLPLDEFDPAATDGTDCWGYTAPSGREYAFIGVDTGTGVAEISNPADVQVVAHLPGAHSEWRDIKTYQQYAYIVSEGGGGIQVYDLSAIDDGVLANLGPVLSGPGTSASHNVAINEASARLYRAGGGSYPIQGLRIYDLANPAAPTYLGSWSGRYCHDVQVTTWTEAPYEGVEVAFCYANDTPNSGSPGIEIVDVSDPTNVTTIGSIDLSQAPIFSHPASYGHQGWLSPDRRYVYFNDEVDEGSQGFVTTTRVVDVQDLASPTQVAIFQNATDARDHNLYTRDDRVYQANYRSGLRVLDASDPLAMSEIAYFDTYPEDDAARYNGLWSVYPYFPSRTVIGCDIEKGLFVWTLDADAPEVPSMSPGSGTTLLGLLLTSATLATLRARRRNLSEPAASRS